ncbi:ribonuclease 3-like [Vicia villosa]|uniref:ribonuclease 3-like n=1 Tax=Vicia villosa TaxID=3911 RepID=UPI00273C2B62|nr:ribonuclease 3-like [Vicia villosa]
MKLSSISFLSKLLILQYLLLQCLSAQDFAFFYFIQQWPGSYCDTKHSCCYPKTGKPIADFTIYGLRPNYNDPSFPSNCDPHSVLDKSKISDLVKNLEKDWPSLSCPSINGLRLWSHEWMQHGTCSESKLIQHNYFETALKLKKKLNLLQILKNAGIEPDDKFYNQYSFLDAIQQATGFLPGIECNRDSSHNSQLLKVYMCVDTSGSKFIECPGVPMGSCGAKVQFPKF